MSSRRLQDMSSRNLQDMSSRHLQDMSSRRLQDMSSRRLQDMSSRRFQDVLQGVFKTSLQDIFKTSTRRLQDVLEDRKLLRWRRVEDVFETCLEDVLKTSSRPTNVCLGYSFRSSHQRCSVTKGVLKICSKFTGEHPCRSVISIKLLCNFIEIALWHGCPPVNLLHIFTTIFLNNTSEGVLL